MREKACGKKALHVTNNYLMFTAWASSYKMQCFELLLFFSPFLDAGKREALADYALVVAVLVMSFVASYFMRDIQSKYGIDHTKQIKYHYKLIFLIGQCSLRAVPNLITPYMETVWQKLLTMLSCPIYCFVLLD